MLAQALVSGLCRSSCVFDVTSSSLYSQPNTTNSESSSDVGDKYFSAQVICTDITPIQPSWVPPNVKFEIDNANQDWARAYESFDFIYARALAGNILNWEKFYREAYRCLKPGAWFETQETSVDWHTQKGEIAEDSPMGQWNKIFQRAARRQAVLSGLLTKTSWRS